MSVARIHAAATPFNAVELDEIDYVQAFDVVFLAHIDHAPTELIRSGHASWTFSSMSFGPTIDAPPSVAISATIANTDSDNDGNAYFPLPAHYVVSAIDDDTGQESRPSGSVSATNDLTLKRNKNVVSWTSVTGADRYRVYKADSEGAFGFIGETDGNSFTDANISADLADGPLEAYNPFGSSSDYPSSVTFFEQRLLWARSRNNPNGLWSSRSADFSNMDVARPTKADDAISMRIQAQKVNSINALVPLRTLLAMTGDGVFVVTGSDEEYLSASPPPLARRQSGRGVSRLKPVVVDETVFFQPAVGAEVRSVGFSFEIDGYQSNDVTIFSPHLFRGHRIVSWAYAEEPLSLLIAVRDDGKVLAFTWQREQQVWGWTYWETDGFVESVCSIPEGGEHRIYWTVLREIDGEERRFVERLDSAKWSDFRAPCFLDCATTFYPDEPTARFFIPHLSGATVSALADGFSVAGITVGADGWVDLGFTVSKAAHIGLSFTSLVETLPLVLQGQDGWAQGKRQMLGDAVIQFSKTQLGDVRIGRAETALYAVKARTHEPLGMPPALFTGPRTVSTAPITDNGSTLFVVSSGPQPMTITAAYIEPSVSET